MNKSNKITLGKKEYGNLVEVEILESSSSYCSISVMHCSVKAEIRIVFSDESRKNATYKTLRVISVYIEQLTGETSFTAEQVTNFALFLERHAQWILEGIRHII